jgi:hypothetical protein
MKDENDPIKDYIFDPQRRARLKGVFASSIVMYAI